jgi:hypothetical protein
MTDGLSYVRTLEPAKRAEAEAWAEMPAAEFQARIGMAIGELRSEIAAIRTPVWKTALRNAGLFAGGMLTAAWAAFFDQTPRP